MVIYHLSFGVEYELEIENDDGMMMMMCAMIYCALEAAVARSQLSLAQCPIKRKTLNSWSPSSQSGGWKLER